MNSRRFATMIGLAGVFAAAASPALAQPRTYYLRSGSTIQEGCFGTCQCATSDPQPLTGTFGLAQGISNCCVVNYTVSNVLWRAPFFSQTITGSGTFERGTQVSFNTSMTLQLSIDAGAAQTFASGSTPPTTPGFPVIQLHLSVPNVGCWNQEMQVNATPLLADWNADGTLTVQDIFDFLQDWFAGNGDANEDGATTVQDIFDFLEAWFAGT